MASVNFKKIKGAGEAKAMMRHTDIEERKLHNHSNEHIDISKNDENVNFIKLSYEQCCKRYDDRIAYLDSLDGQNKRKDRVTLFGLTATVPEGLDRKAGNAFLLDVCRLMENRFGSENIIMATAHWDEVHDYIDPLDGNLKTSRGHLHMYVVPALNDKLNGKAFSSRAAMKSLNKAIDKLAMEKYHVEFLTHGKSKKLSVEELKALSDKEVANRLVEVEKANKSIKAMNDRLDALKEQERAAKASLDKSVAEAERFRSFDITDVIEKKSIKVGLFGNEEALVVKDADAMMSALNNATALAMRAERAEKERKAAEAKVKQAEKAASAVMTEAEDLKKQLREYYIKDLGEKVASGQIDEVDMIKAKAFESAAERYNITMNEADRVLRISKKISTEKTKAAAFDKVLALASKNNILRDILKTIGINIRDREKVHTIAR